MFVVDDGIVKEIFDNHLYCSDHRLRVPDGWEGDACSAWSEFYFYPHL